MELRERPVEVRDWHVEAFNALAHPTRLRIVFFLARAGREVTVGELRDVVGAPGPTLSHHLNVLRQAGLLQRRREERYLYYAIRPGRVAELARLLTACC